MLKTLVLNTGSNAAIFILRMIITFLMTPVFVRNLGNHDYGIWEVVFVIVGYMGLLDLGIRPSLSRFAAYYKSKDDRSALKETYSTAFFYMLVLGVVALVITVSLALIKPDVLADGGNDIKRYRWFLIIIGIQIFFMFPGQIVESALEGFQKYYLKNSISGLLLIISSAVIYISINPGNALLLIAGGNAIASILKYFIFYLIAARLHDYPVRFIVTAVNRDSFILIFRFSLKTFVQGVAYTITMTVDRLVISYIDSIAVLVFFVLPSNLIRLSWDLMATLSHAMMPMFADFHGKNDLVNARKYFIFGSKIIFSLVILDCVGIYLLGSEFITFWVGVEYGEKSQLIITGLVVTSAIYYLNPLGSRYLTAVNQHGILAKTGVVTAFLVGIASILLVTRYGYSGAAYSLVLPALLVSPYVLYVTCDVIGIKVSFYLTKIILPCIVPAIIASICIKLALMQNLITNIYTLIMCSVIIGVIYYTTFFFLGLNIIERNYFKKIIGALK